MNQVVNKHVKIFKGPHKKTGT